MKAGGASLGQRDNGEGREGWTAAKLTWLHPLQQPMEGVGHLESSIPGLGHLG